MNIVLRVSLFSGISTIGGSLRVRLRVRTGLRRLRLLRLRVRLRIGRILLLVPILGL